MVCLKQSFSKRDFPWLLETGRNTSEDKKDTLNQFLANAPILYPLKTPENQRFSGVFSGYKMGTLARNGFR